MRPLREDGVSGVPVYVLLARLAFQLETVGLHLKQGDAEACAPELEEAQRLVALLQKEVR